MQESIRSLLANLTARLIGSEEVAELLVTGLLADGHVLIQGPPGVGKTSLAKTLALSVQCDFKRIQFTPDLLPSDIVGYSIFDQSLREFRFYPGPVFGQIVLADEINRASPRTQSALLEAMNENQVTIDGKTYVLEKPFFVVATENNLSSTGTFPLPDSQLDRFIISFDMSSPDALTQVRILDYHASERASEKAPAVVARDVLVGMQESVRRIHIADSLMEYIVSVCESVRESGLFAGGVSSRASIALMQAARAQALMDDRDSVYPDDIKRIMPFVFRHRLQLQDMNGRQTKRIENLLREVLENVEVPVSASDDSA